MTDDELRAEVEEMRTIYGNGEGLAIETDYMLADMARYKETRRLPDGSYLLCGDWEGVFEAGWYAREELERRFDAESKNLYLGTPRPKNAAPKAGSS